MCIRDRTSRTPFVDAPAMAKGGSARVDAKRRAALQRFIPMFVAVLRSHPDGLNTVKAGQLVQDKAEFKQALKDQRATLLQFAMLFPEHIRIQRQGTKNVLFSVGAAPTGTLMDYA